MTGAVPSIRERLSRALLLWAIGWAAAVAAALWVTTGAEVDELLDDSLRSSAELLGSMVVGRFDPVGGTPIVVRDAPGGRGDRFAWQVVDAAGRVAIRSVFAPDAPLSADREAGYRDAGPWRVFALPLADPQGATLYAAQPRAQRARARLDVVAAAVASALAVWLLGHLWLRGRVRAELDPLQDLSRRLERYDPTGPQASLGPPQRAELQPVQHAIEALSGRLARRIAGERTFAGHAAHALRTPLAGIDAQLAVALREAPPGLRLRLQRVRDAATRLQHVVAGLLGLFRTGSEPRIDTVDLRALVARLPPTGVDVAVASPALVRGDADLIAAALLDLLDNAARYGAQRVRVDVPHSDTIRLSDDGPGMPADRRDALRRALAAQAYDGAAGLGLTLADRVARAHGGALALPATERGFVVELALGHSDAGAARPD